MAFKLYHKLYRNKKIKFQNDALFLRLSEDFVVSLKAKNL